MEWRTNNYLVKEKRSCKRKKMRLVTIQASAFKSTFETLKDILNDVNIFFRPDGVSMCTLDVARTSLVDLFLAKENLKNTNATKRKSSAVSTSQTRSSCSKR